MASELYVETLKGLTSGANANKVIIPAGQTLDASAGGLTLPAGVGGKVLQVVQGTTSTERTSTANSYIDSYLQASITPTSTSSKILVFADQKIQVYIGSAGSYNYAGCRLLRDSTELIDDFYAHSIEAGGSGNNNIATASRVPLNYLDSPSTTSQLTYKTQFKVLRTVNSGSATVQLGSTPSTITLMEIAG